MILFIFFGYMVLSFGGLAIYCYKRISRKKKYDMEVRESRGYGPTFWEKGGPEAPTANSEELLFPFSIAVVFGCLIGIILTVILL